MRLATAALLAIGLVGMNLATVAADNWGADAISASDHRCTTFPDFYSECTPNNRNHDISFSGPMPTALRTAFENSLANDYDTPIDELFTGVITGTNVDVRILYGDYPASWGPNGWAGSVCLDEADGGEYGALGFNRWCRPIVLYVSSVHDDCYADTNCKKWYACHELGHTLGLQHADVEKENHPAGSETCMTYGPWPRPIDLKAHDRNHIRDCFPHPTGSSRPPDCVSND